jgi:prevent-host-death family protein
MKIGIHEAKTKLSKLIPAVLGGDEVIIAKAGKPLVKIVPVVNPGEKRSLGLYAGKIEFSQDFEDPLPDKIIEDFWKESEEDALSS